MNNNDSILEQMYHNAIDNGINQYILLLIGWWLLSDEADHFFNDGVDKRSFWKTSELQEQFDKILQSNVNEADNYVKQAFESGLNIGYSQINRPTGSSFADKKTLYFLKQYNFDLIKGVNQDMINNIRKSLIRAEREGLDTYQTAELIRQADLQPVRNFSPKARAEMISRTETRRARTYGTLQAYQNYDINHVNIIIADNMACEECQYLASKNPYTISEASGLIPVHPNCYHKDTKLFTKNDGWKFVSKINLDDLVLTLNPDTHEVEFQHPKYVIKHKADKLVHIYNNWFDTCITQDHDCFVYQRKQIDNERVYVPEFRKPDELNTESKFYRKCVNNNISPLKVNVNGLELDGDDFIFLLAWFISEGSVLHDDIVSDKYNNPIKISQLNEDNRILLDDRLANISEKYGLKLNVSKTCFRLYSKKLRDYFKQFGYSHEKYLPEILFEFSVNDLRKFLDYYIKGDGHERKPNKLDSVERIIYTSSERLVSDLSYVILLAGYYPSIHVNTTAGTVIKYRGKEYTQNHDVYSLRLNNTDYTQYSSCNSNLIEYNDYVYCVEVPEYHTLWTNYNGKTCWNGNCRCNVSAIVENVQEVIDKNSQPVIDNSIKSSMRD